MSKAAHEQPPLIELSNVSLHYRRQRSLFGTRDQQVLRDISFPIYPGETVGIIGRNGAGKTSLLKLIAGILSPDSGEIRRRTKHVSMLTHQLGFHPHLSGSENAIYSAMLQGMSAREIRRRMPEVIEFAGLEEAIDEPLSSYSSGMRARLGFSVSLLLDPDVLLIDEALGVGDHEFKERSTHAMRERMRSDKTVVVVSHDPFTIKELCDRAVWIENTRVVMQDAPEKVIMAYHDFDRFVGDMALGMGIPATRFRSNTAHNNPLDLIAELREHLREERQRQQLDYAQLTGTEQESGVEVYIPTLRPVLSQLIAEECGSYSWVENTRLLQRGDEETVSAAFAQYERLLLKLSMEMKLAPGKVRTTDWYLQLADLLGSLVASPDLRLADLPPNLIAQLSPKSSA